MKKIDEIHRGNANILHGILIGLFVTTFSIVFSLQLFDLDVLAYLTPDKLVEVLLIIPTMIVVFIIHEFIHVGFFIWFGKEQARIKVSRDRSVGAVVMHQTNDKVFYSKTEMIVILLSPLVMISLALWIIGFFVYLPFLLCANIVLNVMGSSIDLYVVTRILKHRSPIAINFHPSHIIMNIYKYDGIKR